MKEFLRKAIVKIDSGDKKGTGFFISKNIILTGLHVIGNENNISINDKSLEILEIIKDEIRDIVLIVLKENLKVSYMELYDFDIKHEDKWETFGYPGYLRRDGDYLKGSVSSFSEIREEEYYNIVLKLDKTSNFSCEGLSGAPLVIDDCVVGMIIKEISSAIGVEIIRSISMKYIFDFLKKKEIDIKINDEKEKNCKEFLVEIADNIKKVQGLEDITAVDNIISHKELIEKRLEKINDRRINKNDVLIELEKIANNYNFNQHYLEPPKDLFASRNGCLTRL